MRGFLSTISAIRLFAVLLLLSRSLCWLAAVSEVLGIFRAHSEYNLDAPPLTARRGANRALPRLHDPLIRAGLAVF